MVTNAFGISRDQNLTVLWRTNDRAWFSTRVAARKLFLALLLTQLTSWIDRASNLYLMTTIGDCFYNHFPKREKSHEHTFTDE